MFRVFPIALGIFLNTFVTTSVATTIDLVPPAVEVPVKLESHLYDLFKQRSVQKPLPTGREATQRVVVILVPQPNRPSSEIDTTHLVQLGGIVLARSQHLMRVDVPIVALEEVTRIPGVHFVRRPIRPVGERFVTEGITRINAHSNHNNGVKGQDVKVAVIDGGFKGANKLADDMPSRWKTFDYTGKGIYQGDDDDDVHGAACAEIVYDVAPEADLYLLRVDDLVDLENAKDYCVRAGIDIVSQSLAWFGTGFGDGRGIAYPFRKEVHYASYGSRRTAFPAHSALYPCHPR